MFRLWGKIWKDNKLLRDMVVEDPSEDTRTHKIFRGLDEICHSFDLSKPIWLDKTIREFKRHDRVRFTQDNFIESIDLYYDSEDLILEYGGETLDEKTDFKLRDKISSKDPIDLIKN